MSILIRGMEMPENCEECKIKRSRLSCPITGHYVNNYRNERHNICPLVEVPTPHGDLVDIDKALNHLPENYNKEDLEDAVATAPTIIEAEGEKEDV